MRSSSGEYFIAIDHLRALALLMVVIWHFTHGSTGFPVAFDYYPYLLPLSLFDEGHTGVALFMTLSGYLFAKLLSGKVPNFKIFIMNRILRLLPLLVIVLSVTGLYLVLRGKTSIWSYAQTIVSGIIFPTLPNGGWSITVEFHYYLILPLLLYMQRKSKWLPLTIVVAAIAARCLIYSRTGEIQSLAYWTIIGRIDQFVAGMLAFHFRTSLAHRHYVVLGSLIAFSLIYGYFDVWGGFMAVRSHLSVNAVWTFLPSLEGIAYGIIIGWYDSSFSPSNQGISKYIGYAGAYSYSLYLIHYNIVFRAAALIHEYIMDLSNFYVASAWAIICFVAMIPLGYLSFRFIELPFLRLRRRYVYLGQQERSKNADIPLPRGEPRLQDPQVT